MQPHGKRRFGISMGPPSLEAPMVRLYLWAGCWEAPPTSTATGNPITFCSIRLRVRPSSATSAGVRSPGVRTGQRCRLVILWFRPEYTAVFVSSQLSRARVLIEKISHHLQECSLGPPDPSSRRHEWPARIAPQMLHARLPFHPGYWLLPAKSETVCEIDILFRDNGA